MEDVPTLRKANLFMLSRAGDFVLVETFVKEVVRLEAISMQILLSFLGR